MRRPETDGSGFRISERDRIVKCANVEPERPVQCGTFEIERTGDICTDDSNSLCANRTRHIFTRKDFAGGEAADDIGADSAILSPAEGVGGIEIELDFIALPFGLPQFATCGAIDEALLLRCQCVRIGGHGGGLG